MDHVAVAAMGADRPGIVAACAEALERAGASIEDSAMTNLSGSFAMLLVVAGLDAAAAQTTLRPVADELDLILEVHAVTEPSAGAVGHEYVVAAYGPDKPGLIAGVARALADHNVNVEDFGSRLTPDGLYAMWFNVATPAGVDEGALLEAVAPVADRLGLDVSVHETDTAAL